MFKNGHKYLRILGEVEIPPLPNGALRFYQIYTIFGEMRVSGGREGILIPLNKILLTLLEHVFGPFSH